jgi:hypothetical protein
MKKELSVNHRIIAQDGGSTLMGEINASVNTGMLKGTMREAVE